MNWMHKIWNWEYWPAYVVYAPAFVFWLMLSMRFRSIFFFKRLNPAIKNGGLYNDGKDGIYALLPLWSYPKSKLIDHSTEINCKDVLSSLQLDYPVLLKPNVGSRGVLVQKVSTDLEFLTYHQKTSANYLIQEWIDLPNELGLFYYKLPGDRQGKVSGLTLKKFLTVQGDGISSVRDLMLVDPRSRMQINRLSTTIDLNEVLKKDEEKCLVPYGNHNLGTKFVDGSMFINRQVEDYFNGLLGSIDGFYYGRLDIRYNTLSELERGINFKIIELNGAKSEPTHIYDDRHSFLYGQQEIFKHMKIIQKIVERNIKPNCSEGLQYDLRPAKKMFFN